MRATSKTLQRGYFTLWADVLGMIEGCFDWEGEFAWWTYILGVWLKVETRIASKNCTWQSTTWTTRGRMERKCFSSNAPSVINWSGSFDPLLNHLYWKQKKKLGQEAGRQLASCCCYGYQRRDGRRPKTYRYRCENKGKKLCLFSPHAYFWMPCMF